MKKLKVLFLLLTFSCQEEGDLTRSVDNAIINTNPVLKYSGNFEPTNGISVSGKAIIYLEDGKYTLNLNNFNVSSGPDLKVYLSQEVTPVNFVNLGNLTSKTVYLIPDSIDVTSYSYVLIHCQQYNHLFAVAQLTQN